MFFKKWKKGSRSLFAYACGGVCPPKASFMAKPTMPAMYATVAKGALMLSGAGETAIYVPTARSPALTATAMACALLLKPKQKSPPK
jgi:hypothetical protein